MDQFSDSFTILERRGKIRMSCGYPAQVSGRDALGNQAEFSKNERKFDWYALHCHPQKESFVWSELAARNIEVFYPHLRVKPADPRSRKMRPYFPGYLFVYADGNQVASSTFRWLPHVQGLVSFGGIPAPVPEALINEIKQRLEKDNYQLSTPNHLHGDAVEVISPVFSGFEAIFDTYLPGPERVRVLLKMLNERQVILELHKDLIVNKKTIC